MNWFKQTLANVAGTQEPIYGPTAIQAVTEQAKTTPYTELKKDGLRWAAMDSTSVETQTFYVLATSGEIVMLQVIYSNVAGIRTTCQFNTKVMTSSDKASHLWYTNPLDNYGFDADQVSFFADNLSVALSEAGDSYAIKSAVNPDSIVDVTFKRTTPGFVVGDDGTSFFGTDAKNPWGRMRHAFWPRCDVEGTIVAGGKKFDVKGLGFFIHALQGMKPHHAAARWNFISFQSPSHSAVMMEFTTPPSYGTTVVNVGGIVTPTEILTAGAITTATHTSTLQDSENEWPEPSAIKWEWNGKTADGKSVTAVVEGPLGERLDRVDVMAEVPGFVKAIVASAAGTKPYIYQYAPEKPVLKIKVGDEEQSIEGRYFSEATFIS